MPCYNRLMKILFINVASFGNEDIIDAFRHLPDDGTLSHAPEIALFSYENDGLRRDQKIEADLEATIKRERPDFAFSFNYYPIISTVCEKMGLRYVSWVYDSPHVSLYSSTLINKCNAVFVFDSAMYETFASQGIRTVHYLPMAVSSRRLAKVQSSPADVQKFGSDVSFVGSLYTEEHNFYDRMLPKLDPHTRGYLEGLMRAQMQVDGANFVEACLTDDIIKSLEWAYPMPINPDGVETARYLYAQYVLDRKITAMERQELLALIGTRHVVDLYTRDDKFQARGVRMRGTVDYYKQMPQIFRNTKVNLNITLRSITKGIPLRCFDIMGARGFLLSNFQEDFLQFFVPDEDYVFYDGRADLLAKVDYYLNHDDERQRIIDNGYHKVMTDHTYDVRVRQILQTLKEA